MARSRPGLFDVSVGRVIREARRSARLTQEVLAEKLDISTSQLSKYESGRSQITLTAFDKIVRILGVGTMWPDVREGSGFEEGQQAFYSAPDAKQAAVGRIKSAIDVIEEQVATVRLELKKLKPV